VSGAERASGPNSQRLAALGLALPPVPAPAAAYVPAMRHGDLVFVSGQLPLREGRMVATGPVGDGGISLEEARELTQLCALNALAAVAALAGGLDRIRAVLRAEIMVAVRPGFTSTHLVGDGASELFSAVFGADVGHARMALGVVSLPLDAPVAVTTVMALHAASE
jgi:enamine deaminase RidA (YjgF/YER057c/UK114 family)